MSFYPGCRSSRMVVRLYPDTICSYLDSDGDENRRDLVNFSTFGEVLAGSALLVAVRLRTRSRPGSGYASAEGRPDLYKFSPAQSSRAASNAPPNQPASTFDRPKPAVNRHRWHSRSSFCFRGVHERTRSRLVTTRRPLDPKVWSAGDLGATDIRRWRREEKKHFAKVDPISRSSRT